MAEPRFKIGLVGAGAIGTAIAGRLALAAQPISVVARGARRDSILREGLKFREDGATGLVRAPVVDIGDLADRDLVIVATKATALPDLLPQLASALSPAALVMPAVNGLPWWYFQGKGPLSGTVLHAVDPDGAMQRLFESGRLIGCVVYSRAAMGEDGEVKVFGTQRLKIGAVAAEPPVAAVAAQLAAAGITTEVEQDIRSAVWAKLVRNASSNPVSALTNATLEQIGRDDGLTEIVRAIIREVIGLSERLGCHAGVDLDQVIAEIRQAGPFATSMLQDVRAGRVPELDAIAAAPLEAAHLIGHDMPVLRRVAALLRARLRYAASVQ